MGAAHEDAAYAMVERTRITHHVKVLTVWSGLDCNPFRDPPLIFSSIIRAHGKHVHEIESATEAEARLAHALLVELAKAELTGCGTWVVKRLWWVQADSAEEAFRLATGEPTLFAVSMAALCQHPQSDAATQICPDCGLAMN